MQNRRTDTCRFRGGKLGADLAFRRFLCRRGRRCGGKPDGSAQIGIYGSNLNDLTRASIYLPRTNCCEQSAQAKSNAAKF